jgi:molybdopterin synthase catalytic subunit
MAVVSVASPAPLHAPDGDDWLACTSAPLDQGAAAAWVVVEDCGATVTFAGTVRDHAEGRTGVTRLDYEAYEEQVEAALARVAAATRQRWPMVGRLVLWHRTGSLAPTDAAVVVAVSTPHRTEAFDAARWALDEVKSTAPIWKREHHDDGVSWGRCDSTSDHGDIGAPWGRPTEVMV